MQTHFALPSVLHPMPSGFVSVVVERKEFGVLPRFLTECNFHEVGVLLEGFIDVGNGFADVRLFLGPESLLLKLR